MPKPDTTPGTTPRAPYTESPDDEPRYRSAGFGDSAYEGPGSSSQSPAFRDPLYERDDELEHEDEQAQGAEHPSAAHHQTTTGAVNRDLDEQDEDSAPHEQWHRDGAETYQQETRTGEDGEHEDVEGDGHDIAEPGDAMSGDAIRIRPHSMPMQPGPAARDVDTAHDEEATNTTAASTTTGDPAVSTTGPGASTGQAQTVAAADTAQSLTGAHTAPVGQSATAGGHDLPTDPGPLLAPEASQGFRDRWHTAQAAFIDDPHQAVQDADRLLTDLAGAFTSSVEQRRRSLTSVWGSGGQGETEQLRLALRQYRSLVERLLHD